MLKIFSKFFDENQKKIKKFQTVVEEINKLESIYEDLSDDDLLEKTAQFKSEIKSLLKQNKTEAQALEIILPDAFAAVREAGKRTLGLRHYDVQLIAGMSFHYGSITEQKTGEGKTLSATLALYLNSLLGKGTHL